jgi:outer membrane protein OmpA-like peptidoglycan-associated protein
MLLAPWLVGFAGCQSSTKEGASGQGPKSVVFFTGESAAIGPEARSVVTEAARQARSRPGVPVLVRGFAAPDGSVGFNRALSEARARNVADELVVAGVAQDRIRVEPRGPVPYEAMQVESRRVEITVGN